MNWLAVVFDREAARQGICRQVLESEGLRVLLASSPEDTARKVVAYLPHLLVVGATHGLQENETAWINSLGPRTLALTRIVFSGSLELEERLRACCRELRKTGEIHWRAPSAGASLPAELSLEGQVVGISETGLCVDAGWAAPRPVSGLKGTLPFFEEDGSGLRRPVLRLVNSQAQDPPPSGSGPCARNYFQILGWTDRERQSLRAWATRLRMSAVEVSSHGQHFDR